MKVHGLVIAAALIVCGVGSAQAAHKRGGAEADDLEGSDLATVPLSKEMPPSLFHLQ